MTKDKINLHLLPTWLKYLISLSVNCLSWYWQRGL
jgi:hypothetical protein